MRVVVPARPCSAMRFPVRSVQREIWLKREDLSPASVPIQIRGAYNDLRKTGRRRASLDCLRQCGQSCAKWWPMLRASECAAALFSCPSRPPRKIDKTRAFGGDAVRNSVCGRLFVDDTLAAAQAYCAKAGAHFLSPFDDDDVNRKAKPPFGVEVLSDLAEPPICDPCPWARQEDCPRHALLFDSQAAGNPAFRLVEPSGGMSWTARFARGRRL